MANIDNAIARNPLDDALTVFRGLGAAYSRKLEDEGLDIGERVRHRAFVSTSRSISEAKKFLEPDGLLFEIKLPASTFGLDMVSFSKYPSEEETLCPRGIVFVVTGYDEDRDVVTAEVEVYE